jgi:hypothetical protein
VTLCTEAFIGLAREESRALGMPELPIAIIQHPLGGLKGEQVAQRAREALEQVVVGLTRARH